MNNIEALSQVLRALDSIEVKGFSNVCALAASMQILQTIIKGDPVLDGQEEQASADETP